MRNNEFLIRTLLLAGLLWQLLVFRYTPGQPFRELFREIGFLAFLGWFVSVLFRQNRDDDDWAF